MFSCFLLKFLSFYLSHFSLWSIWYLLLDMMWSRGQSSMCPRGGLSTLLKRSPSILPFRGPFVINWVALVLDSLISLIVCPCDPPPDGYPEYTRKNSYVKRQPNQNGLMDWTGVQVHFNSVLVIIDLTVHLLSACNAPFWDSKTYHIYVCWYVFTYSFFF